MDQIVLVYENINVRVMCNNTLTSIKNEEVVVGDIIYLESRKIISRDGKVIEDFIGGILVAISYLFNVIFISNDFNMDVIVTLLKDPRYIFDNIIYALTLTVTIIIVCVPEGCYSL